MPLMSLEKISLAYGLQPLLLNVDFQIDRGERVCLIGRNGTGKSTCLKVMEGELLPDTGSVWREPGLKIARLEQELPEFSEKTVFDYVSEGLEDVGLLLSQYHHLAQEAICEKKLEELARLQHEIESKDGWLLQQRVDSIISRLSLPQDSQMKSLSGGWRRRVALGRALVNEPDILLLDEPTNHLDLLTIEWLEKQVLLFKGAVIFITHDRSLLKALATRVIELDRGVLTSWTGDYESFLVNKAHQLEVEQQHNALFDKKLAEEEVWIRQGIKARRTRNEGRVRALEALRLERSKRLEVTGKASFQIGTGDSSGKLVAELDAVSFDYQGESVISNFSGTVLRGDRIGLIGANGVGKSTLLKLILGQLQPKSGKIKRGTKLDIAYYYQLRDQLDLEKTVLDNVVGGSDFVEVNGKPRHIYSYLNDFLFSSERARTPVKALSGGERNRLLLAKLFSLPANLLVMDEPTNDLDIETLELLEQLLTDFGGTILLVSHDRSFINNIVTSTFVFEGQGIVKEYVGGFDDWLRQGGDISLLGSDRQGKVAGNTNESNASSEELSSSTVSATDPIPKQKKLSYKLQKELETLPGKIEQLEIELNDLRDVIAGTEFYSQAHDVVNSTLKQLSDKESELEICFDRWSELDG